MRNFIEIDGVKWATCNIGNSGEFVANPEDYGGLYTWKEAQRACPKGWRLPTKEELEALIDAGSVRTARNGVEGHLFGTAPNQIFLPVAGLRHKNGALTTGGWGYYWSSMKINVFLAWNLHILSCNASVDSRNRALGFSVRCVAED